MISDSSDEIKSNVADILEDYSTILYVSSVSVKELLLLYRIGKLKSQRFKSEQVILDNLKNVGIKTVFFNEHHFSKYSQLQIADGHKDMNDHAIIAQAISDKIPLISSDHAFKNYVSQGLDFVFNRR
jgi:PIN domain nuclease of toxin-antitoxin system